MEHKVDFEKYEKKKNQGELIVFGGILLLGISLGIGYIIYNHFHNPCSKLEQKTQNGITIPADTLQIDTTNYLKRIKYFETYL